MPGCSLHYEPLSASQLAELDAEQTLALMAEVRSDRPPFGEPLLWALRFIEGSV